jgi:hypothetical protein
VSNNHENMTNTRLPPSRQNSDSAVPRVESYSSTTAPISEETVYGSNASQRASKKESFVHESNNFLYRDSYFHLIANVIGTLISSLIPIVSVVVLYFITEMPMRLAMVGLFTAIFSIALSLVTSGTRVEIFAATAA